MTCDACDMEIPEGGRYVLLDVQIHMYPFEAAIGSGHTHSTGCLCGECYRWAGALMLYDHSFPAQRPKFK